VREIGEKFKFSSTGTVRDYLRALTRKGYIKLSERKSRGIELIRSLTQGIPILGRVAAGEPNLAVEDIEGYIDLEEFQPHLASDVFALRVKGDSMIDAGIHEGDLVIVKRQGTALTGQIVVALINSDEATVKYIKQKDGKIYLQPANAKYKPIFAEFTIIGKVIAVFRKYV
jgi:repressor LexA